MANSVSNEKIYGKEILGQDDSRHHVKELYWLLKNFSNLPKYLCSNQYSLALGCDLLWRVEVDICRSTIQEHILNLQTRLYRMDCVKRTVCANLHITLQDNKDELLHDGLCSSAFTSDNTISPCCMSVKLNNPCFLNLPCDQLVLKIILKTDNCCSVTNSPDPNDEEVSTTHSLNYRITKLLRDLKIAHDSEFMADVLLTAGEHSMHANKFILCARSPVLRKILENDTRTDLECNLDPRGEFAIAFRIFLLYLYTGHLDDISAEVACTLYSMADKYEVRFLQMSCGHILLSKIDTKNACRILRLAHLHNDLFLKDFAVRFIFKNYKEVTITSDWKHLIECDTTLHSEILEFCATHVSVTF